MHAIFQSFSQGILKVWLKGCNCLLNMFSLISLDMCLTLQCMNVLVSVKKVELFLLMKNKCVPGRCTVLFFCMILSVLHRFQFLQDW